MDSVSDNLRKYCHTPGLVRTWAYGFLDQMVTEYAEGRITEQILRRDHYMLQQAVEGRLQEIEKAEKDAALRRLMITRERLQASREGYKSS